MKKITPKIKFSPGLLLLMLAVFAVGCNKLDNFDADDFSLFGDDEDKKDVSELRRYSESNLNLPPVMEFIVDHSNKMSTMYDSHLKKISDYTKLPYKATELKAWNTSPVIAPSTRVLCLLETKKLSQQTINKILDFVAGGGTLVLPFAGDDTRAAFLMGFSPLAEYETDTKGKGFYFNYPMLPNLKDKTYNEEAAHFGFAAQNFAKSAKVLTTTMDKKTPLVLENKIGKGKVIYYNTTMTFEKIDRGFLFSGILKGLEGIPYPIANTSTIFLDDFPSPVYDIKSEPVKSEMNLTITDFVNKVWWPDMKKLADKYKISYSAMLAFDYKNNVDPPFIFDQWDLHKIKTSKKTEILSDWLVHDSKKHGHELALHGYNHVSFKKGLWKNPVFIGTALKAVQKKWEVSNFGALPVTYVPPSNIIDAAGVDDLKKGMPSIKYMCSLYLGDKEEGGDREFDFDPYNKDMFDYPRISDGFYMGSDKKYAQQSLYLFTGVWTHFVHPDDIYQIPSPMTKSQGDFDLRNIRGLGWYKTNGKNVGLFSEFNEYLRQMAVTYPKMRYVNAGEGGRIVNDWRASQFTHKSGEGTYTVKELNPDKSISDQQYWFMYGSVENAAKLDAQLKNDGAEFSKTPYMDGYLYSIFTQESKLTLQDLNFKTPAQKKEMANTAKRVQQEYKTYAVKAKKHQMGEDVQWVDDSEKKFRLELETMKRKMLATEKIDSVTWNKYAKYLSWEDRGLEVWKMLEDHCMKYPLKDNIMYSKELDRVIGYPNELTQEKWLSAQMLVTPNDIDLLNSYVASFYTPENQEKIRQALINLLKVDTSFTTYLQYIEHLLTYDREAARKELDDKVPDEKFRSVATDIAWLYADNNEFKKAYEWSVFSEDIDFPSKMSWLIEMKAYKILDAEYKKYIAQNPDDYKSKAIMAGIYHETGRFKDAWVLANSLPDSPEKDELRAMLNKDVVYVEEPLQQDLIANHPQLFYPDVLKSLMKAIRKEQGDFIAYNGMRETNKENVSAFKNVLSYNFYDKKKNLHSIAGTYSKMYKVLPLIKDDAKDNVNHELYGVQYQFTSPVKEEKLQYWSRIRGEYSDFKKYYFQFGMGANITKGKNYKSAEFKVFPAETGPAHSKDIYHAQLNIYQDYYFLKHFNGSISLEGNLYTKSKSRTVFKTGETYEGSITGKLIWDDGVERKSQFLPFLESSYTQASLGKTIGNFSAGYPYWVIDNRFYGGGGLGWKYGKSDSNFTTRLEAGWFYDDYSSDFKRYMGEANYQIFDYTALSLSFELYTQSKFYSNAIQFGVKYNLKKKQKK